MFVNSSFENAFAPPNAIVSCETYVFGEEWGDTTIDEDTWTDVVIGSQTWTQTTVGYDTWH